MTRTDEIRERCERATLAPWRMTISNLIVDGNGRALFHGDGAKANADLIAHAREDIPWLVAENAKKDAEITRLEAERDAAVADLMEAGYCFTCRKNNASQCPYRDEDYEPPYPWDDPHRSDEAIDCYEWRGIQAATGAEERMEGE